MTPDLALQMAGLVFAALSVYVGIRVDLARTNLKAQDAHDLAKNCNDRLDNHIENHLKGQK